MISLSSNGYAYEDTQAYKHPLSNTPGLRGKTAAGDMNNRAAYVDDASIRPEMQKLCAPPPPVPCHHLSA